MASPRALGAEVTHNAQRCMHCDADVLFLATCPACGTPAGGSTGGSAKSVLTNDQRGELLSFAEAARTRSRAVLPEQVSQAWIPPKEKKSPSSSEVRTDEWLGTAPPRRFTLPGRRGIAAIAATIAVGVGISLIVTQSSQNNGRTLLNPPKLQAPQRFHAAGLPFKAAFPASPAVTHERLHLLKLPYTASTYSASVGSSMVSVGVYPFPLGNAKGYGIRSFVRHFLAISGSARTTSPLRMTSSTKVQGIPAVRVATTTDGGRTAGFGVVVLDGHIAYEILAIGPSQTVDATFHHFMHGFRIVDPGLGTTI